MTRIAPTDPLFAGFSIVAAPFQRHNYALFGEKLAELSRFVREQGRAQGMAASLTDFETGCDLHSSDAGLVKAIRLYTYHEGQVNDRIWQIHPDHEKSGKNWFSVYATHQTGPVGNVQSLTSRKYQVRELHLIAEIQGAVDSMGENPGAQMQGKQASFEQR